MKLNLLTFFIATCFALVANAKPTLLFVHGGAWVSGRAAEYIELAEVLTARGYCVDVVEYRLAPAVKHPGQVDDLNAAVEKIVKEKSTDCDRTQVILMGHSAGAHMIAYWASVYPNKSVKGFIGFEGIYDLHELIKKWPAYKDQFVVKEFGGSDNWSSASPSTLKLKNKAPWLILHSQDDELVDVGQSKTFEKHLKSQNVKATLTVVKNETHFGVIESLKEKTSPATIAVERFIKSVAK